MKKPVGSIATSCIVFACVFGGALLGMAFRSFLPEHHLDVDSKNIVNLGMALIGTMSALLLGLLIASAKGSYDAQRGELLQMSADIVQLDRLLARYGPQTTETRAVLRRAVALINQSWSEDTSRSERLDSPTLKAEITNFYESIQGLSPRNDFERSLQSQALQTAVEIARTRSILLEQVGSSIPTPFLIVVVFWLSVIFTSFGLFAPRNATVVVTLFVCAVSVSAAIFLIIELDSPFSGLLQISNAPLQEALAHLGN